MVANQKDTGTAIHQLVLQSSKHVGVNNSVVPVPVPNGKETFVKVSEAASITSEDTNATLSSSEAKTDAEVNNHSDASSVHHLITEDVLEVENNADVKEDVGAQAVAQPVVTDGTEAGDDVAGAEASGAKLSQEKKSKVGTKKASVQVRALKKKKLKASKPKPSNETAAADSWTPKPGQKLPVEIIYTSTSVDIMWQDGATELSVLSTDLFPVLHLDDLEFFPGDFVISTSEIQMTDVYGVIQSADHSGRTCRVKWMRHCQTTGEDNVLKVEEVSVYDIKEHPDMKFRPSNVVIRMTSEPTKEPNSSLRPAGQVFELGLDGQMLIQWDDGSQSHCCPHQLYLFGDDGTFADDAEESAFSSSDEESSSLDEEEDSDWETEEEIALPLDDTNPVIGQLDTVEEEEPSRSNLAAKDFNDILRKITDLLSKMDKLVAAVMSSSGTAIPVKLYRHVIQLIRVCCNFDSAAKTSLFGGNELEMMIAEIKKHIKRGKPEHHEKPAVVASTVESSAKQLPKETAINDEGDCDSGLDQSPLGPEPKAICSNDNPNSADDSHHVLLNKDEKPPSSDSNAQFSDQASTVQFQSPAVGSSPAADNNASATDDTADRTQHLPDTNVDSPVVIVLTKLRKLCQQLKQFGRISPLENEALQPSCSAVELLCEKISSNVDGIKSTIQQSAATSEPVCDKAPSVEQLNQDASACQQSSGFSLSLTLEGSQSEGMDTASKTPLTPVDIKEKIEFNPAGFTLVDSDPEFHRFKDSRHTPIDSKLFNSTVRKEMKLLQSSLPHGIYVKGFESRMDLYSVMIEGPSRTPYEDGLFFFDVQLPENYPSSPPHFFYVSYCTDRLNPNLYEDGKVCVSLLGTWTGRGTEVWHSKSNLLQVLVSIQGLILNPEPYYNEAGYERQKGTQLALENSRMYNEMAVLKMVQSMTKLALKPHSQFTKEIRVHLEKRGHGFIGRLRHWICMSETKPAEGAAAPSNGVLQSESSASEDSAKTLHQPENQQDNQLLPEFPLLPMSKGFILSLSKCLDSFESVLTSISIQNR